MLPKLSNSTALKLQLKALSEQIRCCGMHDSLQEMTWSRTDEMASSICRILHGAIISKIPDAHHKIIIALMGMDRSQQETFRDFADFSKR